jgi:hypothetical protein
MSGTVYREIPRKEEPGFLCSWPRGLEATCRRNAASVICFADSIPLVLGPWTMGRPLSPGRRTDPVLVRSPTICLLPAD